MKHATTYNLFATRISQVIFGLGILLFVSAANADLTPDAQAKADKYKQKLTEWAADPAVIAATKSANSTGPIPGMTNGKWEELSESDPAVTGILANAPSKLLSKWEEDKALNKLYLRDMNGNFVAGSSKPLLYNNANREFFKEAIKGNAWNQPAAKPDPTTQIKSIQVSAPVKDGGKTIGVIHTAVTVE